MARSMVLMDAELLEQILGRLISIERHVAGRDPHAVDRGLVDAIASSAIGPKEFLAKELVELGVIDPRLRLALNDCGIDPRALGAAESDDVIKMAGKRLSAIEHRQIGAHVLMRVRKSRLGIVWRLRLCEFREFDTRKRATD